MVLLEFAVRHLKCCENPSGWWNNERQLCPFCAHTLHVRRLGCWGCRLHRVIAFHRCLSAQACRSFGVSGLSDSVLYLEDASDDSFWEHLEKLKNNLLYLPIHLLIIIFKGLWNIHSRLLDNIRPTYSGKLNS